MDDATGNHGHNKEVAMDAPTIGSDAAPSFDTLLYRVRPGDSLTKILKRYHSITDEKKLQALIRQVLEDNPSLENPDLIKPDQLIRLNIPQQYCPVPHPWQYLFTVRTEDLLWVSAFEHSWSSSSREERTMMAYMLPAFIAGGNGKLSALETTFTSNRALLTAMVDNYEKYKAGEKTKGQYDYQRKRLVTELTDNLGPTSVIVNGNQAPSEVLRISRTRGVAPTAPIGQQLSKLKTTASIAKGGGVVLTGVSLGIACDQIAQAVNTREKNEVFVETAGGVVGGVIYGLASGLAVGLMATPVGWVGGLIIGAGGAIAGLTSGAIAKKVYDISGNKVDFVSMTRVDEVCVTRQARPLKRINSVHSNNAIYSH